MLGRRVAETSTPSPRAGLLASKGFRRHRGCLGSRSRRVGGRARRGDFNLVASNENALCKEIARTASFGEMGWPGSADTGIPAAPLLHLTRCLSACANVLIVLIDFFLKARWRRLRVWCTEIYIHKHRYRGAYRLHRVVHKEYPPYMHTHSPHHQQHHHTHHRPTSTHTSKEPWVKGVVPEYCPRLGGGRASEKRR